MRFTWPFKTHASENRLNEQPRVFDPNARPDFLCVGAQKGGTTWLYQQLRSHEDFWMPPRKELHYFDLLSRHKPVAPPCPRDQRDFRFLDDLKRLGAHSHIDLENYAQLFEPKGSLISGDITPAYSMLHDEMIDRIIDYLPQLKVIFLARDPVERAWSQLSMAVRAQNINPFDVTNSEEVMRNLLLPGVFLCSHPSKIVARWRRWVHPDRFRLYFFDDLERNPSELRRSIICFLGGDPQKPSGRLTPKHNSSARKEKLQLNERVRSHIARFFEPELKACATELGGPASEWPVRYGFSWLLFFAGLADNFDLLLSFDWML